MNNFFVVGLAALIFGAGFACCGYFFGSPVLDHVSVAVKDYEESVNFYTQTLKILGYKKVLDVDCKARNLKISGFGKRILPCFEIIETGDKARVDEEVGNARGMHIAFRAPNVQAIKDWYKKCLELGAKDNGAPGPRLHYHRGYYAAFVIDPNGWRIEACLHTNFF